MTQTQVEHSNSTSPHSGIHPLIFVNFLEFYFAFLISESDPSILLPLESALSVDFQIWQTGIPKSGNFQIGDIGNPLLDVFV